MEVNGESIELTGEDAEAEGCSQGALTVYDVANLLRRRYVIITGGRGGLGCPILTFPDTDSCGDAELPCWVSDDQFRQLIIYLTSLPTLNDADAGFVLVIDRRTARWSSLKAALLHISAFFPGLISVCYVLRPCGFIQGTWTDIGYKFSRDDFKFKIVICSSLNELHSYIDRSQLTRDLGGEIPHNQNQWIQQRMEVEKFSLRSHGVSELLNQFIGQLKCSELPVDVATSENMLKSQTQTYDQLKRHLLAVAERGEVQLMDIRQQSCPTGDCNAQSRYTSDILINVTTIERLLVQLEETARKFENHWLRYHDRLHQWLLARKFERARKDCQVKAEQLLTRVGEMVAVGESVPHVDTLITELGGVSEQFEHVGALIDELEQFGQLIVQQTVPSGEDSTQYQLASSCVMAQCDELRRNARAISDRLSQRSKLLSKCRHLHVRVEQANNWCSMGVKLLSSMQPMDGLNGEPITAANCLEQLEQLMETAAQLGVDTQSRQQLIDSFHDVITPETRPLVQQVVQRLEDVQTMCEQRCGHLRRTLDSRANRPVLSVLPNTGHDSASTSAVAGAAGVLSKMAPDSISSSSVPSLLQCDTVSMAPSSDGSARLSVNQLAVKRERIIGELVSTEQSYVHELRQIVTGYQDRLDDPSVSSLLPHQAAAHWPVLFGNLRQLLDFHAGHLLPQLLEAGQQLKLIGSCFVRHSATIRELYAAYCVNKPASDAIRQQLGICTVGGGFGGAVGGECGAADAFFVECQRQLCHKLPLAAYLLKPVQRVTKYQLMLRDLMRYGGNTIECQQLHDAVECILDTLEQLNCSMQQLAISGFQGSAVDLGRLLLQAPYLVWIDGKKDKLKEFRHKPRRRHVFLYEKMIIFCKRTSDSKPRYIFKNRLQMSEVGLTECVKGDACRFELWLPSRSEVFTLRSKNVDAKNKWVVEIKRVLMQQLCQLKGQKCRQYGQKDVMVGAAMPSVPMSAPIMGTACSVISPPALNSSHNMHVTYTRAHDTPAGGGGGGGRGVTTERVAERLRHNGLVSPTASTDTSSIGGHSNSVEDVYSSDCTSDEETSLSANFNERHKRTSRYIALADYQAVDECELCLTEGTTVELLAVGSAGWWYVRVLASGVKGWAPAPYLEKVVSGGLCSQMDEPVGTAP